MPVSQSVGKFMSTGSTHPGVDNIFNDIITAVK
jgi:hypothetical protein